MKKLYDALVEFVTTVDEKYCIANDNGSNKNLEEQFRLLACNFLYGGYISVNDRYRIYISGPLSSISIVNWRVSSISTTPVCTIATILQERR